MEKVALIGLGVMGHRIGANLAKSGALSVIYNRSVEKAKRFSEQFGVKCAEHPNDVLKSADIIITVLSDDDAVSSVIRQFHELKGKTVIEMSTISPTLSVELAREVSEKGGAMLDAPIVGTSLMVEKREITILVGGAPQDFERVKRILELLSRSVVYVGQNGMGLYAKIVTNLVLGSYIASIAEAFSLGLKAGLSAQVIERIFTELSSTRSPASQLKMPKIAKADYSTQFALKHMRKDLEIVQREAQRLKAITPISDLAMQLYRACESLGYSEEDFCSIAELYKRLSQTL